MSDSKAHGMTDREWLEMFDRGEWKSKVLEACLQVAACDHAAPSDRQFALAVWSDLIHLELAPRRLPDGTPFPEVVRDVQLAIVSGRPAAVDEALRDTCSERMVGVRWLLNTVAQFMREEIPSRRAAPPAPATTN